MSIAKMKEEILTIVKNDSVNGIKSGDWVNFRPFVKRIASLEGKEKSDFDAALAELISEGIFESRENGDYLTEKGVSVLNKL